MKKQILLLLLLPLAALAQQQQTVPDVTLQTTDGKSVSLRSYVGKGPLQIAFWALWCEPCKQELKVMSQVYDSLNKQGYTLLGVCEDNQKSMAKVRGFASAKGWNFPILLDPNGDALRKLNGLNIPFSLIVDKEGNIKSTHIGYVAGDEVPVEKEIHELLPQANANAGGGTGK